MPEALAINVAANTTLPGFRAPIAPDGRFVYVPIPEREPTREDVAVPTYGDLEFSLPVDTPGDLADRRVHLDPEFAGHHGSREYTYGDEHGVKAGPISDLEAGDYLLFYATLERLDDPGGDYPDWAPPEWGAYLIGGFRLAVDPVTGEGYADLSPDLRDRFANNAHVKRASFDAKVLALGDPGASALFDRAVPLSDPAVGADPNRIVTELSADSGRGPWWRRPLRFDETATEKLLSVLRDRHGVWDPE
ncbi:hypothetical protein BRD00_07730 [Halobacteriales archaeon QS_8_69_26]|nr:MAG: hypothetical protein BRD00_07730 [Halobacteriales archaeon QS_8_69_26]